MIVKRKQEKEKKKKSVICSSLSKANTRESVVVNGHVRFRKSEQILPAQINDKIWICSLTTTYSCQELWKVVYSSTQMKASVY